MHIAEHAAIETLGTAATLAAKTEFPFWCPWPLPTGWLVTGYGWAGDERTGVSATVVACSGPASLIDGPADMLFIAEDPGVGLGVRFAGLPGPDPGPTIAELAVTTLAHAKVKVGGHPAPMWALDAPEDRSAYVGEARGRWLWTVAWPAPAGYLLAEDLSLHDLAEWIPGGIVFGAASPYLSRRS
ncbi:hypothetical protein HDA40_004082 [Hamadaea flava]|nr:hypothetical protein [Hamadaea flava]